MQFGPEYLHFQQKFFHQGNSLFKAAQSEEGGGQQLVTKNDKNKYLNRNRYSRNKMNYENKLLTIYSGEEVQT